MALQFSHSSVMDSMGEGAFCQSFYGAWRSHDDCIRAVAKLEHNSTLAQYTIDGSGAHVLPFYVESGQSERPLPMDLTDPRRGNCMVQAEVAGPRNPRELDIVPDEIRNMANRVLKTCVEGKDTSGGFTTSDMTALKAWVISAETDLSNYYPTHTSFMTVSLSNVVSDWLSPGNFDPIIPQLLAKTEFAASSKVPGASPLSIELRRRANRFLRQQVEMDPRGQRIPWWGNPTSDSIRGGDGTPSLIRVGGNNGTKYNMSQLKAII
ncbi:hypothetical protein ACLMJK_004175 [Lecanora helva]